MGLTSKLSTFLKKKKILTDTLSRASLDEVPAEEDELQANMVERVSISETKYAELQQNTANELHALYTMIQVGWPETSPTQYPSVLGHMWWASSSRWCHLPRHEVRKPPSMRPAMLAVINGTHLGIVRCKQREKKRFTGLEWVLRLKKKSKFVLSAMTMLRRNRKSHWY